jgi:hypothetical protein
MLAGLGRLCGLSRLRRVLAGDSNAAAAESDLGEDGYRAPDVINR